MRKHICISLSAMIAVLVLPENLSFAETKKDIRGFYPEMTWTEFETNLKSINGISKYCADLKQIRWHVLKENDLQCEVGNFPDNGERFTFSFYKPPNNTTTNALLLKSIDFQFGSNIPTLEMMAHVSEQYGIDPYEKNQTYIDDSTSLKSLFSSVVGHGRMIARWKLSDELVLELKGIPAYGLELSSQRLLLLEGVERRRLIEKQNAAKSAPKF